MTRQTVGRLLSVAVVVLILTGSWGVEAAPVRGIPPGSPGSGSADPAKGKVLFNHFCAACHGLTAKGNGVNAAHLDPSPSNLIGREVIDLKDQEIFDVIENGGAAAGLSVSMPAWGRTLPKDQINHIIAYIRFLQAPPGPNPLTSKESHSVEPGTVRFASLEQGGKADCPICHRKEVTRRQLAPNIGHEGSKLHREWLYGFLKKPHKIRPIGFIPLTKTTMPNFQLSDDQLNAVVEYLMSVQDPGISPRDFGVLNADPEQVEKGKKLFSDRFACDACHRIGGEGGVIGPDLKEASRRLRPEWMLHWLKNPQSIRPDSPMPNLGLTDAEARSLIAYVLASGDGPSPSRDERPLNTELVKKGEALVKEKNCIFCHTLDSYNSNERNLMATYEVLVQTTER